MSYVPFTSLNTSQSALNNGSSSPLLSTTPQARSDQQRQITEFIDKVFAGRDYLTYQDYHDINTNKSSEMFIALMKVLHNNLPCTKNYYQLK